MFNNLQRALMDFVTALPKKDLQNRREIRDTILELQADLDRALILTIAYIDGIQRIRPIEAKNELLDQLSRAPSKLLDAYNEFKICAGIYSLADKFRTIFSGLHASIHIPNALRVPDMVRELANGERIVIDELRNTTDMLAAAAQELQGISLDEVYLERHKALLQRLKLEREYLNSQKKELVGTIRRILVLL